jgi:chemotaxis methyl-accepting protein methylase
MALTECIEASGSEVPMQIFATDLNATGIAVARAGLYSKNIFQALGRRRA